MSFRKGFETVNAVVQHQNTLINQVGYQSKKLRWTGAEILKYEEDRLRQLRDKLRSEEQNLLSSTGVGDLKTLLQKIREWNASGAEVLLNNGGTDTWNLINDILQKSGIDLFQQNFKQALKSGNTAFTSIFIQDSGDNQSIPKLAQDEAFALISEGLNSNNVHSDGSKGHRFNKQLAKYIIVDEIMVGKGRARKPVQRISFSNNLSPYYQKQLTMKFNELMDNTFDQMSRLSDEIRREIINKVMSSLPISGSAKSYIEQTLNQNFMNTQSFDLNASVASAKGFLGEVYWTAFWRFVTNGRVTVTPTGAMRTMTGVSGEIPIDIVINGIGLQVKNYKIEADGTHRLDKTIQLREFISNRLEMPTEAFDNFFISWGYNKVATDAESYPNAETVYRPIFERFTRIATFLSEGGLESIANSRLDKVLRIDSEFTTMEDSLFNNLTGDLKANTLFLFNQYPIFSSDIIDAMLECFGDGSVEIKLENFDVDINEPFLDPYWETEKENSAKPSAAMKTSHVSYTIMIDVNQLMSRVLSRLYR